ncbi:hypothetical protein PQR25_36780 [Paraburkholderia nemoris]|uniref:hypothetical protein n=1 Tax=Paraburkholderia nemoris TaxID=2793076 RepID=UPI0038B87402
MLGLGLIGVAGFTAYQLQLQWLPIAEAMTTSKLPVKHPLTSEEFKEFESHVNFFLWLLPFVTGSWGTNILSDALLRDFRYEEQWIVKGVVRRILFGEPVFGSRKYIRLSLESRRDISAMARLDLHALLARLPQFASVGNMGCLINMIDGSTVMPYKPRDDQDTFACKLTVSWKSSTTPLDFEAEQYMKVQFHVASTLGCNTASFRRQAEELYSEIRGW